MTFATPVLAGIAAAIAVPALIILYFLKLRRRDVEVSSTLLWKKAIQDLQANAPFQKLRRNVLLLLQLIVLALALFALAQPEFKDTGTANQRRIILIDRSASMAAMDGESGEGARDAAGSSKVSRLEAAKKQALEMVESLREPGFFNERAEEAMVIVFDTAAEVRQPFTSSKAELRQAISGIEATDAPSSLERAFALAKAYTGTKKFEDQVDDRPGYGFIPTTPGATLHVYSDGRLPDAERIQTEIQDSVVYHAIGGKTTPNVAITSLRAERAFDNPSRVNVFVGLQNSSRAGPCDVEVELRIDDATVALTDTTVGPAAPPAGAEAAAADAREAGEAAVEADWTPGIGGLIFPLDRSEGGVATVRITPKAAEADALATDNLAYVVIPPAKRLSVALVTTGNLFIQSALQGMNLSRLDVRSPAEFQKLLDSGQTAQYDVFIFDKVLPDVKAAAPAPTPAGGGTAPTPAAPVPDRRPGLPPGRSLVLGVVPPPPLGATDLGTEQGGLFISYDRDHPALRLSGLDNVAIGVNRKVQIEPETPVRGLAFTDKGPSILEVSDPNTMAVVVPFDPAESNWPFDPGWVLFLVNSTLYLSDTNAGEVGGMLRVGETMSTRLPAGATDARITLPDNERLPLEPSSDGSVAFGPVSHTGIYTVSWVGQATATDAEIDGRVRRPLAANLLDPAESDIGARGTLSMAREVIRAQEEREVALTQKLWPWLLLAALAVVMLEWFVYNRKVTL